MAETKARAVRVSDAVWVAAQVRARNEGRTVTDVIVEALAAYGDVTEAPPSR